MIKLLAITTVLLSCSSLTNQSIDSGYDKSDFNPPKVVNTKSIYDFKVAGLEGDMIDFSKFKGKKILIVNTASKCGYTPQYADLQKLYVTYKEKLVVVGFPANNFGGQEPGTSLEIRELCKSNYGVTFPMAAKVSVKGDDIAPIYKWLCSKAENGVMDAEIKWNFGKFLLDENGRLMNYFPSKVTPMSEEITGKL